MRSLKACDGTVALPGPEIRVEDVTFASGFGMEPTLVSESGKWSASSTATSASASAAAPAAREGNAAILPQLGGGRYTFAGLAAVSRLNSSVRSAGADGQWSAGAAAAAATTQPVTRGSGSGASAGVQGNPPKRQRMSSDDSSCSWRVADDVSSPSSERVRDTVQTGFGADSIGGDSLLSPLNAARKLGAVGGHAPPKPVSRGSATPLASAKEGGRGRRGRGSVDPGLPRSPGTSVSLEMAGAQGSASAYVDGGGSSGGNGSRVALASANFQVGKVQALCPLEEAHDRIANGDLNVLERPQDGKKGVVVKRFHRPAAGIDDTAMEKLLRSPEYLARTVDYITHHCIDKGRQGGGGRESWFADPRFEPFLDKFRRDNPTRAALAEEELGNTVRLTQAGVN